ncbi:hypothetical protein EON66_01400 [archaeon]|nr:MAG: hypothetical protein EON66_01400 [archaeon]
MSPWCSFKKRATSDFELRYSASIPSAGYAIAMILHKSYAQTCAGACAQARDSERTRAGGGVRASRWRREGTLA